MERVYSYNPGTCTGPGIQRNYINKVYIPGCLCQVFAGPAAARVTNDDDVVHESVRGSDAHAVSIATEAAVLMTFTANSHVH